jgi:orotate phosphoribosyltransferase
MEKYKESFIEFMVDCEVLKFGDFVTKSGRRTPFFVNTGFYRTGGQLKKLGEYYAKAIEDAFGTDFDVLFGPAYKGIPLSVATTIALSEDCGKRSGIAPTARRSRITATRASFSAVRSRMVTRL